MACSASIRLSLRWIPSDPYEDTNTLVLSIHNHFLDIRIKKDETSIDWAFAGLKRIEADGRNVWSHAIDSRGWKDEDAGYISVLENGDELETGTMKNPDAGDAVMRHEEVWRCLDVGREYGYIAKRKDGLAWVAFLDRWVLELCQGVDGFSVARYERSGNGHWVRVAAVGQRHVFQEISDEIIMALREKEVWEVIASIGI